MSEGLLRIAVGMPLDARGGGAGAGARARTGRLRGSRRSDGRLMLVFYVTPEAAETIDAAFPGAEITPVEPGWEDRWRSFHRPARAGGLWIGPPWEHPDPGEPAVVIDPGRAFGTGAHPTTRLCVELLARTERGSLLDVGCGSGVLSIAAARLGFGPVVSVDIDPVAVETTIANADRERRRSWQAVVLDGETDELPRADVAVANVLLAPVERILVRLDAQRRDHVRLPRGRAARRPRLAFRGPGRGGGLGCRPLRAPHDLEDGPRGISPSCRAAPRKTDWTSGSSGAGSNRHSNTSPASSPSPETACSHARGRPSARRRGRNGSGPACRARPHARGSRVAPAARRHARPSPPAPPAPPAPLRARASAGQDAARRHLRACLGHSPMLEDEQAVRPHHVHDHTLPRRHHAIVRRGRRPDRSNRAARGTSTVARSDRSEPGGASASPAPSGP